MQLRWSRLGIPLCLFNRHAPVRGAAKWNGKAYASTCRYCAAPVVRRGRGQWLAAAVGQGAGSA